MADTKIKAGQFFGVVGHGTDGYFLMTNADGSMSWAEGGSAGPSVTSVAYPGDDLAADPAGAQTVVLTGTGFASSGMTVSIGGTTAPSVAHDSNTQLTITTPAKAAGDYDIVVTNTVTGASGTFVNGISYNGIPTWTTAAGSLGTFDSETTISTITLQATEPDGGTITFNITNGALPTGLSLTGANIDGTTTAESSTTLYSFTIEAIDDENQATPRNFSITVNSAELVPSQNFTINTYTGNGSTQSIEGKIGTAASFNGSSSYVNLPNLGISGSQARTVSLWVKLNSIPPSAVHQLYSQGNNTSKEAFNIETTTSGKIQVSYYTREWIGSTTLATSTWYHIVVTYNGGAIETEANTQIYINGVAETGKTTTSTGTGTPITVNSNYALGYRRNISSLFYDGSIDQVRIFNKAVSSSEVTTLYNEPSNLSTASTTDIFDDGSGVALYEFEKGAIDTGGVNGYIGSAGVFNGSSSKLTNMPFIAANSNYSVSLWFKTSSSTRQSIIASNSSTHSIALNIYNGQLAIHETSVGDSDTFTGTWNDGSWHHLVMVNKSKIYVDGVERGTTAQDLFENEKLEFGYWEHSGPIYNYNGSIDQVRIFNKAISSSEVTTLYGETSASATKSTTDIFDDGSGVALYELEGNANDTGLYGRGAIDSGQSAVFNGSSSYIDTNAKIPASLDFSFSFWFKSTSTATNQYIFSTKGNSATNGWWIQSNAGTIRYGEGNGSNNGVTQTSPASTYADGSWHHVVVTRASGGTVNMYIDGDQVITDGSVGVNYMTSSVWAHDLHIGRYAASALYYFNGSLDQVRIYSSVLSASDVEALVSETNVPTANLVAHYKLDGNANDETTNYNGTATSITYSDPAEFPTYDGTATNVSYGYDGTPTNVGFVGTSFQPDLVWLKGRNNASWNHFLQDSIRGAENFLISSLSNAEATTSPHIVDSFDTNGFTVLGNGNSNTNGDTYVAWCWKAADTTTTIAANTIGNTIASDVRANPDAGFSIVSYTGAGSVKTVGHGLSQSPELMFIKNRANRHGAAYHSGVNSTGYLFTTTYGNESFNSARNDWFNNSTPPTSSVFTVKSYDGAGNDTQDYVGNYTGDNYIAYCFHSVDGYQKVGSYTGVTTGVTVTTGFRPRFIMVKSSSNVENWAILDTVRGSTKVLAPNTSSAEYVHPGFTFTVSDTGFSFPHQDIADATVNQNGYTYIYLAIA